MTNTAHVSNEIDGKGRTIAEILSRRKYSIDYYQREYRWGKKQLTELIEDLTNKFLESYEEGNDRSAVAQYGHYFLGSIIICDKSGEKFIIDGQQRLTTLTLLLIFLHHQVDDEEMKGQVADLIFSQKFGKRSFNLDVPERTPCMEAIYREDDYINHDPSESVVNIQARFGDLTDIFPEECLGNALPYFVDWLIENVHLIEITAYSDSDAYTIFETMNDRGLSLTPAEMLKGYLLANIQDSDKRNQSSKIWQKHIESLRDVGKDEGADAIKAWLRSQHAQSTRQRKRGAKPEDFDLIGTEFHRWVRDHEDSLKLDGSMAFSKLIERDFAFYASWYERIRRAANTLTTGLERIHYNAQYNFTLQYPLLLASLRMDDTEEVLLKKLRVVATYIDILIHRRIWNTRAISYSSMQYAMFLVMKEIRGASLDQLVSTLSDQLNKETEVFSSNQRFRLHGMNGRWIHRILARMTDYIGIQSGQTTRYSEYIQGGKGGYDIEHIWANHPERHSDEFAHASDFQEYRNRIGGLLLLPKKFNQSYGDLSYEKKMPHYIGQNLLAQSLCDQAYDHNPGFTRYIIENALPFKSHPEFMKSDLDARQELYIKIAEAIWNPNLLSVSAST